MLLFWGLRKTSQTFHNFVLALFSSTWTTVRIWNEKELLKLRAFVYPLVSQTRTEVSKLLCECTAVAHRLIKCNWILLWVWGPPFSAQCQQAWMPSGLDVSWMWYILQIPTALLCSHLVFFCYHESFSLTKTWGFLWQKLFAQEHMLNKMKVWKTS